MGSEGILGFDNVAVGTAPDHFDGGVFGADLGGREVDFLEGLDLFLHCYVIIIGS